MHLRNQSLASKFGTPAKYGRELKCYKLPVRSGNHLVELKKQHTTQVVARSDSVPPSGILLVL